MNKLKRAWTILKQPFRECHHWLSHTGRYKGFSLVMALTVAGILLFVWIVYELVVPPIRPHPVPTDYRLDLASKDKLSEQNSSLFDYEKSIAGKPVFKHSRRTTVQSRVLPVAKQSVPLPTSADFTLMGIMGDDTLVAFIQDRKTGDSYSVTVGQSIGIVVVKEITARSVVLIVNESEIKLVL